MQSERECGMDLGSALVISSSFLSTSPGTGLPPIPIWGIALALAAIAPFCVGAIAEFLERKRRERTAHAIREAKSDAPK